MSKYFEITETEIKPYMGYGWMESEQFNDLANEGYDVTSLGTDILYVIDGDDGRVFVPVDPTGIIAREGYTHGWRHEGEVLYWWEDEQQWVEWEELPRKEQKRRVLRDPKRWVPRRMPIPEPKRD